MKQVFIFLMLWLLVLGSLQAQTCRIQLSTDLANIGRTRDPYGLVSMPTGSTPVTLPVNHQLDFMLIGATATPNAILRVTYPDRFTVGGTQSSTPIWHNRANRQISYVVPNQNGTTASTGLIFGGAFSCELCDTLVEFRLEVIDPLDSNNVLCNATFTANLWNENVSLGGHEPILPPSPNRSIMRGTTVRYSVSIGQGNTCFGQTDNAETYTLIETVPTGAIFVGAVGVHYHTYQNVALPPSNNSNGIIEIPLITPLRAIYVDIHYPCNFPANSATNRMSLRHTRTRPCRSTRTIPLFKGGVASANPNDETIPVIDAPPNNGGASGALTKSLRNTSPPFVGGTRVQYWIQFTNNGNFPINQVTVTDMLPPQLRGTGRYEIGVNTPLNVEYFDGTTSTWMPNLNTTTNADGFRVSLGPNEVLMPGEGFGFIIWTDIDTNTPGGTAVTNTATAVFTALVPDCSTPSTPPIAGGGGGNGTGTGTGTGTGGGGGNSTPPVTPTVGIVGNVSASDTLTLSPDNEPIITVATKGCERNCLEVGDEFTVYLMAFNRGTGAIGSNGLTINHTLPSNVEFVGTENIYLVPSGTTDLSWDPCAEGGLSILSNNITNAVTRNHTSSTSLSWQLGAGLLQASINPSVTVPEVLVIAYRCKVISDVPTSGSFGIGTFSSVPSGMVSRSPSTTSYFYDYVMCDRYQITGNKEVSTNGTDYASPVNAAPGSRVFYKLVLKNTGNQPLSNIRLADDMPHQGDLDLTNINGGSCAARNSSFAIEAVHSNVAGATLSYFQGHAPCLSTFFDYSHINSSSSSLNCCGGNPPTTTSATPSSTGFVLDFGGRILQPGGELEYIFEGTIPQDAANNSAACNNFIYRASGASGSTVVLATGQTNPVCVTIQTQSPGNEPCNCINPETGEPFQVDCPSGNCEECCKERGGPVVVVTPPNEGDCITEDGTRRQSPIITGISVTNGVATINAVSNHQNMSLQYSIDRRTWSNRNTFSPVNSGGFIAYVRYADKQCEVSSEYKPTNSPCNCIDKEGKPFQVDCPSGNCEECCKEQGGTIVVATPCNCINDEGKPFQVDCPSGNCEECCKERGGTVVVVTPPNEGDCITEKGERRQSPTITGISVTNGVATINAVSNYQNMSLQYSIDGSTWQNANTFNLSNSRGFTAYVRYADKQCEVSSEYKPTNIGGGSPCNCIDKEGKPFQVDCPSGKCEECCKERGGTVAGTTPTGEGDCITVKGERRQSPTVTSINLSAAQIVINATSNVPNMGLQYSLDGTTWQSSNTFVAQGRAGGFPIQNMTVYVRYIDGQCQVSYYHRGVMTNDDKTKLEVKTLGDLVSYAFLKKGETTPAYTMQILVPAGMDIAKMFEGSEQAADYTMTEISRKPLDANTKIGTAKNDPPLAFPFFDANGDLLLIGTKDGQVLSFSKVVGQNAAYGIDAFMPIYKAIGKIRKVEPISDELFSRRVLLK